MVVDNQRKDTTKINFWSVKSRLFFKVLQFTYRRLYDERTQFIWLERRDSPLCKCIWSKVVTRVSLLTTEMSSIPADQELMWLVFACPCVENWNLLPLRDKFAWHRSQGILAAHRIAHILLPNHQAPRSMTCPLGKKQKYRWQFQAKNYFFM